MALNIARLSGNLANVIEQKIRQSILDNDNTPYPDLTKFAQSLAQSIAQEVVEEITMHAEVSGHVTATITGTTNPMANTCQVVLADGNNSLIGGIS